MPRTSRRVAHGPRLTPTSGRRRYASISNRSKCMWCVGSSSTPSSTTFVDTEVKNVSPTSKESAVFEPSLFGRACAFYLFIRAHRT